MFNLESNNLYLGDCLDLMTSIPNESVDLIATDPPYKITPHGGSGNAGGMFVGDLALKGKFFEHNDIDIEQYLSQFYRVLKKDTHCYIMCNHVNLAHFLDVISKSEFHFIKSLIWVKNNKIMGRYYMNQFEYILFLRKGDRKVNNCGISDVLSIPNKKEKNNDGSNVHDSQKPIELFRILINQSTNKNELVLDPFAGSGTTCLAAMQEKRQYLGIEIDEKYFEIAKKRIEQQNMQLTLF